LASAAQTLTRAEVAKVLIIHWRRRPQGAGRTEPTAAAAAMFEVRATVGQGAS